MLQRLNEHSSKHILFVFQLTLQRKDFRRGTWDRRAVQGRLRLGYSNRGSEMPCEQFHSRFRWPTLKALQRERTAKNRRGKCARMI